MRPRKVPVSAKPLPMDRPNKALGPKSRANDATRPKPPLAPQPDPMTSQAWQNLILAQLCARVATASPREIKTWLELMVRGRKLYTDPKEDPKVAYERREEARAAVIAKIEQMLNDMNDPNWVAPTFD
jgi:hypothetical protein